MDPERFMNYLQCVVMHWWTNQNLPQLSLTEAGTGRVVISQPASHQKASLQRTIHLNCDLVTSKEWKIKKEIRKDPAVDCSDGSRTWTSSMRNWRETIFFSGSSNFPLRWNSKQLLVLSNYEHSWGELASHFRYYVYLESKGEWLKSRCMSTTKFWSNTHVGRGRGREVHTSKWSFPFHGFLLLLAT